MSKNIDITINYKKSGLHYNINKNISTCINYQKKKKGYVISTSERTDTHVKLVK